MNSPSAPAKVPQARSYPRKPTCKPAAKQALYSMFAQRERQFRYPECRNGIGLNVPGIVRSRNGSRIPRHPNAPPNARNSAHYARSAVSKVVRQNEFTVGNGVGSVRLQGMSVVIEGTGKFSSVGRTTNNGTAGNQR